MAGAGWTEIIACDPRDPLYSGPSVCGGAPIVAGQTLAQPTPGSASSTSAPPMLGGCCACRRTGAAAGGTAAEQLAAALERPGPIGLPWWVWVLLVLVVLNLLRS